MKLKKIISVFVTIAMIMSMVAMVYAVPDFDDALVFIFDSGDESYPGTSGEGWNWDLATKTLTIDGLNMHTQYETIILPDESTIVVSEDSMNNIVSDIGEAIIVYGDLEITGAGTLSISGYTGIRVDGNIHIEGLTILEMNCDGYGIYAGPGKELRSEILVTEETLPEIEDYGNIAIIDTGLVSINSFNSAIRANGNLVIDNVEEIEIVVDQDWYYMPVIEVGRYWYYVDTVLEIDEETDNFYENNGNATITNVGSLSTVSYSTSIQVMGNLYIENVDYIDLVSYWSDGIIAGRDNRILYNLGDEEFDFGYSGNVEIVNCGEVWIDADYSGIRTTGDLIVDTIEYFDLVSNYYGILAGVSYQHGPLAENSLQNESEGIVQIKNVDELNINFGYIGINSKSGIDIFNSMITILQSQIQPKMLAMPYIRDGYGLYASAGDITIQNSGVIVNANTFGIVTGYNFRNYRDFAGLFDATIQKIDDYSPSDEMIGGDINIIRSLVISEVSGEMGIAAISSGNASSIDTTKREIIIQKAKIVDPEDGVVLDVDITFITPSMVIDYPEFYIDQSITGNTEISLIESFDDMAKIAMILPVFTVTYDANTGTGTMEDANSPYFVDDEVEVMANTFAKTGYEFAGFNTEVDGSGIDYQSGDTFTIEGYDVVLYAQYDINVYTVTFNDFDDTLIGTDSVEHGRNATAPADPEREGYTFTGWDKSLDNINENTTITAQYELDIDYIEELVKKAEETKDQNDVDKAREWIMFLEEGEIKGDFDERLDEVQFEIDNSPDPGDRFPLSSVVLLLLLSAAVVVFATRKENAFRINE